MQFKTRYARHSLTHIPEPGWEGALASSNGHPAELTKSRVVEKNASLPIGGAPKRVFDLMSALTGILLLLPLLCLVALIVKAASRGPVFYRHQRVGHNNAKFYCLKFRTMIVDGDEVLQHHLATDPEAAREWEATRKLKNDPRVTTLGHILRKSSVDELPQLLNILRGEMSFVGPRPIVTAEARKYGASIEHYKRARPGLTGAWQVSGRNDVDYDTRVAFDRHYVETWSFWRDLSIIVRTFRVLVTSKGCY
ncbi:MAG: sugar transferase [Alphaproteobacteria bacterium]|nr:sugar transferase [Alphaproteobacteria bacterium]MBV9860777.1 sugar transferase [Alphaproteobacteria bacterium]